MFIHTKLVFKTTDTIGEYILIEKDGFEYNGAVALCCGGPTSAQKSLQKSQISYYDTLTEQAKKEFGDASSIFKQLTSQFSPILAAGKDQEGYSPAEMARLQSLAATTQGQAYSSAERAVKEQMDAGGNILPRGARTRVATGLATSAAQNLADTQLGIKEASSQLGRSNWLTAAQILSGAPGVYGTSHGGAEVANVAGSSAEKTASDVQQAGNSWMNLVGGALGGISSGIGMGLGNMMSPGSTSAGSGKCYVAAKVFGGWDDPRTILVRNYLFTDFNQSWYGSLLTKLYEKYGEWVSNQKMLVAALKPLFYLALKKANNGRN